MGRSKIIAEKKKKILTLNIDIDLYERFKKLGINNQSKFFNWLLEQHLGLFNKKGE
jgi:uncharacterized protein (DUF4415 family)